MPVEGGKREGEGDGGKREGGRNGKVTCEDRRGDLYYSSSFVILSLIAFSFLSSRFFVTVA